jgi:hypothetical protein
MLQRKGKVQHCPVIGKFVVPCKDPRPKGIQSLAGQECAENGEGTPKLAVAARCSLDASTGYGLFDDERGTAILSVA